jgi:ABC-type multidrug transport system ATPase subunit
LVDEPSVGLAPLAVDQVLSAIAKLQADCRLTVMMAEQSIVQAIRLASGSYLISHGQIAEEMDMNRAMSSEDDVRKHASRGERMKSPSLTPTAPRNLRSAHKRARDVAPAFVPHGLDRMSWGFLRWVVRF